VILVDTSVWIGHLRSSDPLLVQRLDAGEVLGHPWVTGELALGNLRDRAEVLALLGRLPQGVVAADGEVLHFIEAEALRGLGIGWVDVQLLASTLLSDARLWTQDRRLGTIASRLGCAS
jgi:hypothetical protein